jgi:WD40 repeat protein
VPRDVRQFAVHTDQTWDVTFAADSKSFVTASQNGRVKRWPTTAFRPATEHCQLAGAVTHTLDMADGNRKIYVATDDRIVCIERKDRRLEERELFSHGAEELKLSPDGHTLAAIQNLQPLVLYDLMSGVRVKELGLPTGKSPCLSWHPNGQTLAVVGGKGSVELWNWHEGSKVTHQFFDEPKVTLTGVGFNHDGTRMAVYRQYLQTLLIDTTDYQVIAKIDGTTSDFTFSPDGRLLAVILSDGTMRVFATKSGELLTVLPGREESISAKAMD